MDSEHIIYSDEDGVTITSTRAIFGSITYAMANISSIRTTEVPPSIGVPVLLIIVGVILFFISFATTLVLIAIGAILIVIGIIWIKSVSSDYHIMITSSSGETSALHSKNAKYIKSIEKAINEAIVSRG